MLPGATEHIHRSQLQEHQQPVNKINISIKENQTLADIFVESYLII